MNKHLELCCNFMGCFIVNQLSFACENFSGGLLGLVCLKLKRRVLFYSFYWFHLCALWSYHLLQRFNLIHVNIMSKTFIAEVSYPARCTSEFTQTINIIASTTRVEAFLRTILPKKSRLATWWKRIKSYMFLEIMTFLLHCISTWILLKNELVHLHIDIY